MHCILHITSDVGYLVGNFYNARLIGEGRVLTRALKIGKVNSLLARTDAVLGNLTAVGNDTVTHGVGQVKIASALVVVLKKLDVIYRPYAVFFVPEILADMLL